MKFIPQAKRQAQIVNLVGILVLFLLLIVINTTGLINRYQQGILVQCCFYIIMTVSLNISVGFLGQLTLGHAGFMAVGAYSSALLTKALTNANILSGSDPFSVFMLLLIAVLFGAIMAGIFGMIIGIPALRLRGDYLAIITLGFGEIIRVVIQNLAFAGGKGLSAGSAGQPLIGIPNLANIYVIFFITVGCIALIFMFVRSRFGRAIISIREDDIASEASGVNNTYYKVLAFTISAFFAGVAGAIFAHRGLSTIQVGDFSFLASTQFVLFVVLGGMGSLTGSIVAAIGLAILPEMLRSFSQYRMLIYSIVLILVMIYRPIGLCGNYEFSLYRVLQRIKRRTGGRGRRIPPVQEGGQIHE